MTNARSLKVVSVEDLDYSIFDNISVLKRPKGRRKNKCSYYDLVCGFDIETTTIKEIKQAFMYLWQFQVGREMTIIGRDWPSFKNMIENVYSRLNASNCKLVVLDHNLSYEWQWLKSVLNIEDVFAMDDRKVLYFTTDKLEFRCTYLHSNMKLEQYVKRMGSSYSKVSGYDYEKIRYPWTKLSEFETEYGVMDVVSLVDAYMLEMEKDGDTLYTIPYTSTGYVRREAKKVMRECKVRYMLPDADVFNGLRQAFRGGNTHANRYNANRILEDVESVDISSDYHKQLCDMAFPTKFVERPVNKLRQALRLNRACLIRIYIKDLKLKDEAFPFPYLAKGKMEACHNYELDNGRILSMEHGILWLTEIDLKILQMEYTFSYKVLKLYTSRKKRLPKPLRDMVLGMYRYKTGLKGTGDDYAYSKYKNKLNAVFGMMVQNPCKVNYIMNKEHDLVMNEEETIEELVAKYQKNGWLPYQWGVWITAYARLQLEYAIHAIPYDDAVYIDTDSIKYMGNHWDAIEALNSRYLNEDLSAVDSKGKTHYIGIFENEGRYEKFATMGAKKYVYVQNGELHVTISGVNKEEGAKELESIYNFTEGFTFHKAGGTMAVYNDHPEMEYIEREGKKIPIISNIALLPSTYTLGMSGDYDRLLRILMSSNIAYALHYER